MLLIKKTGRRLFKRTLNKEQGDNTLNLVLNNIAFIPNFHVNIISKARLRKLGIWFYKEDCSLCYNSLEDNVKLKTLVRE